MAKIKRYLLHSLGMLIVLSVSSFVAGKYFYRPSLDQYEKFKDFTFRQKVAKERREYKCPNGLGTLNVKGGIVCRRNIPSSVYRKIFDTYPISSGGKEQLYRFLSEGDLKDANLMVKNKIPIERYGSVDFGNTTSWNENPANERYWRFLYYGFRPMKNLFYATDKTNNKVYLRKAEEIANSFLDKGVDKPHSWDDYHAVSFRTMFLVKLWWELRVNNMLSYETNEKILKALEKHAEFLADPNHYDKGYNHGLNEAAALYLLPNSFPEFKHSPVWLKLAKERMNDGLLNVVDKDGVLIENSPYYHFYTLEKYWEIYKFSLDHNSKISDIFNTRLKQMISYGEYILQPDLRIPLLGASLDRKIFYNGIYKEISEIFPEFKYVLTKGQEGNVPKKLNIVYPESGEILMRSGWEKNKNYDDQTQLIFDAGPYRTLHSDFDALSFSLYGEDINLLPDAGLYTYERNKLKEYFHGTSSHNTVTVDNKDQIEGTAKIGQYIETNSYVSQSAEHELYKGVVHKRTITMVGKKYILIIDKLSSNDNHLYKQLFHLFPGAKINVEGGIVHVSKKIKSKDQEVMNIFQLNSEKITLNTIINQLNPPKGLCSRKYGKILPCYSIEYNNKSANSTFITLIEIGKHDKHLNYSINNNKINIYTSEQVIQVNYSEKNGRNGEIKIDDHNQFTINENKKLTLNRNFWEIDQKKSGKGGFMRNTQNSLLISPPLDGNSFFTFLPTYINLSQSNLFLRLKVTGRQDVKDMEISLSNQNWKSYATLRLTNAYREGYDQTWLNMSLGKSLKRDKSGGWKLTGSSFSWSNIDNIRIRFAGKNGKVPKLEISSLGTVKSPKEGEVILIFDDGYESIIPAIEEMTKYNFKGNIAVIADRVKNNERGYLSLKQLTNIKDSYGWSLLNHSEHHVDAVDAYFNKKKLDEFEDDLFNGEKFLISNGLNTTPNWYIYPHGSTNSDIKGIVSKYYIFARTTINQPENYPFGDPFGVTTMSADSTETSGIKKFVPISDIESAVDDTQLYNQPLFITFHRIHSSNTDKPGFEIEEFKKLIKYLSDKKTHVVTLNEFDIENDIHQETVHYVEKEPTQLKLNVDIHSISIFQKAYYFWSDRLNDLKKFNQGKKMYN